MPGFRVEREVPSRVARRLHAGEVDLGARPVDRVRLRRLRDRARGRDREPGPVRSVLLFHHGPLERVRRVALDTSSRTSVALVKILLRERLGRDPQYVPMGPSLVDMLAVADAALLIGDPALDHEGDAARLDLGEEWTRTTGLPFVYAFWAGRAGAVGAAGVGRLQAALAGGPRGPARDRRRATREARRPRAAKYEAYLRENIVYRLGEEEQAGLRRVLPPRPRALAHPGRPGAEVPCRSVTRSAGRCGTASGSPARRGSPCCATATSSSSGALADAVRWRKHPEPVVTYIIDRNINYTNVCTAQCAFCAFYRDLPLDGGVRALEGASSRRRSRRRSPSAGDQILLQGGLHPDLGIEYYEGLFRWIKESYPILDPRPLAGRGAAHRAGLEARRSRRRCGG